jgi:hypothetical protein
MLKRQGYTPVDFMFGEALPHRRSLVMQGEQLQDRRGKLWLFVGTDKDGKPILAETEHELEQMKRQLVQDRLHHHVAGEAVAPSAEDAFFDNPQKREVREFGEVGAMTNDPEVAADIEATGEAPEVEAALVKETPPTPAEVVEEPGGEELSTLNRFVVETEQDIPGVPEGHAEVPKHPDIKAAWRNLEARLRTVSQAALQKAIFKAMRRIEALAEATIDALVRQKRLNRDVVSFPALGGTRGVTRLTVP